MSRCACFAIVLGACGAQLDTAGDAAVAPPQDVAHVAIDARPCTGGDGAASDGTNCFIFHLGPDTWVDASAACVAAATHLAIITTAAQNTLIAGMTQGHDTFLGATDAVTEGTWLWVDGTAMVYDNWRIGVPDNGGGQYQEDCLVIEGAKTPNDTWDDRPCDPTQVPTSGSFPFICEF